MTEAKQDKWGQIAEEAIEAEQAEQTEQADAEAAGVSPRQSPDITTADFEHFVTLTEQFSKQQAWY